MYDFQYNYMKVRYPYVDQLKLLFTDTDSLTYYIETDMVKDSHLFDFSDYPDDHPCFDNLSPNSVNDIKQRNKKVTGKFKDELQGISIEEFVGVRPKLHSMMYMKERIIEVDEEGEEKVVNISSSTGFF